MESLEISAKTVDEAIRRALEQLGVSREEVEVTILKEGRPGILGLGAEEALIRVTPLASLPDSNKPVTPDDQSDVREITRAVLERLLALLGVSGTVVPQAQPVATEEEGETTAAIVFNINGDDLGILIGRRGQTLTCLQHVVRLIVSQQAKRWVPVVLDVEGYRQRRYQALEVFARHMAEQVKTKRQSFTLEPMPAYERRVVHLALADFPGIKTQSVGEGEARKVVISPEKY